MTNLQPMLLQQDLRSDIQYDPFMSGPQPSLRVGPTGTGFAPNPFEKDVANDPFLTHSVAMNREAREDVGLDPFLNAPPLPVQRDPSYAKKRSGFFGVGSGDSYGNGYGDGDGDGYGDDYGNRSCSAICWTCGKGCVSCLGGLQLCFVRAEVAGIKSCRACGNEIHAITVESVLWPWAIFVLFLMLGIIMRHFTGLWVIIPFIFGVGQLYKVVSWVMAGREAKAVKPASSAIIGLVMMMAGLLVASATWTTSARQLWWMYTGVHQLGEMTTADTPAAARSDSAWIHFAGPTSNSPNLAPSMVDTTRSAGFRDGSLYCVAPVLTMNSTQGGLTLVNYWAVGVDCCDSLGGFTCDGSRDQYSEFGITMLDNGYPCPGCNKNQFDGAVKKAQAAFDFITAPGALYIKWVKTPLETSNYLIKMTCAIVFIAITVAFFGCTFLAVVMHHVEPRISKVDPWDSIIAHEKLNHPMLDEERGYYM